MCLVKLEERESSMYEWFSLPLFRLLYLFDRLIPKSSFFDTVISKQAIVFQTVFPNLPLI